MNKGKKTLGIYIHVPFCRNRCGYCDFNTYAGMEHFLNEYVDSTIKEIEFFSKQYSNDHMVVSIYFGGGTPTIMPEDAFKKIINTIQDHFLVNTEAEISSEANPANLNKGYMNGLRQAGINRMSVGMQSAVKKELDVLGRLQTFSKVKQSVQNIRAAGIDNLNLDLIFGIPTQTLDSFIYSVNEALALEPDHLSIYGLTVEETTPLAKNIKMGLVPDIDEDTAGGMYEWVMDALEENNYTQYEISNWARENEQIDYRCVHNIQYWKNQDYLGIGAGAHSFVEAYRWFNTYAIPDYIRGINEGAQASGFGHRAVSGWSQLEKTDIIKETMMMGLRLTDEGINLAQFRDRFSLDIATLYQAEIEKLVSRGLIEYAVHQNCEALRLTKKGRSVGNQVFLEFV